MCACVSDCVSECVNESEKSSYNWLQEGACKRLVPKDPIGAAKALRLALQLAIAITVVLLANVAIWVQAVREYNSLRCLSLVFKASDHVFSRRADWTTKRIETQRLRVRV